MFGLAVLLAMGVYLLLSVGVVKWAIRYARDNGKSAKRWGWGAAFVMYSLVFWDWIPTIATHQYYCAKDSGFWVYKTLDQWKAENPGVMEGLVAQRVLSSVREGDMLNYTDTYAFNQRINWVVKQGRVVSLLPVLRTGQVAVDTKDGKPLARQIDFGSYDQAWGGLKFWTSIQHCSSGESYIINLGNFTNQFKGEAK
jgi:hypothetical protein